MFFRSANRDLKGFLPLPILGPNETFEKSQCIFWGLPFRKASRAISEIGLEVFSNSTEEARITKTNKTSE
jgi:hypothetical protein